MEKATFKVCDCENPMAHGYLYLPNNMRSKPIFSLKDARATLNSAVNEGMISSFSVLEIIQNIIEAGIPEDGPSEVDIQRFQQEQKDYEKSFVDFIKMLGIPEENVIVINVADLNAPE